MNLSRANLFAISIAIAFLLPVAIPNEGVDFQYFFIMVIVLFAWFLIKWSGVVSITRRSGKIDVLLGLSVIAGDYAFNAVRESSVGIADLVVIFLGAVILSYGVKSLKFFWVPAAYGVVLLVGYQIETLTPNYVAVQNWLAGVMASTLRALGITAKATGEIVTMNTPDGTPLLLDVAGACTGLQGILAFGMLSTMTLLDIKPKLSRIIPIFAIGFLGAFLINIVRLLAVLLTFEFFGVEAGTTMHVYAGYTIFIVWVLVFWTLALKYLAPRQPLVNTLSQFEPKLKS